MTTNTRNTQSLSIIAAANVSKVVTGPDGELTILDDINFAVSARERVAITGVSGSGKSTLLGLLAGLDSVSGGSIEVLGHDLTTLDEDARAQLRRRHIGFVFQAFHLVQSFNAQENVMLALELKGVSDAASAARAMLERVGLGDRLHHFPRQLSGGEQQRVAIARAFSNRPRILFADEPTGNLDAETGATVIALLAEMHGSTDATLVLVTHDEALAARADRIVSLRGGRIVSDVGQ